MSTIALLKLVRVEFTWSYIKQYLLNVFILL